MFKRRNISRREPRHVVTEALDSSLLWLTAVPSRRALSKHSVLKYNLVSCHQQPPNCTAAKNHSSNYAAVAIFFARLSFVSGVFLLVIVAHKMCNVKTEHFLLWLFPLFVSQLVATLTKSPFSSVLQVLYAEKCQVGAGGHIRPDREVSGISLHPWKNKSAASVSSVRSFSLRRVQLWNR